MEFYDEVPSAKAVEDIIRKYHVKCAVKAAERNVSAAQNEPSVIEPPQENQYIDENGGEGFFEPPPAETETGGGVSNFEGDFRRSVIGDNCCCNPCRRNCCRVSPRAVRLCQEIIDRMKDIRAILVMLERQESVSDVREFNRMIGEKTANIRIMERVYECLTGCCPFEWRQDYYYVRGFCGGLRQAFLEQSAVIDKIAALNRFILDPALSRAVTSVGASELNALRDINGLYARCR